MLIFALFVIAVCIPVLIKVHQVLGEVEGEPDERIDNWNWPDREWARSSTEERS